MRPAGRERLTLIAALVRLLRSAARLDRTQSDPIVSLRNAIGVAAPLAIGALLGNAAFGLPSTIGALQTAFADRPGPYRLRMLRMLGTALAAGITSTLAVLFSHTDVGSALLLLVLAFGAGLLLTGGPSATQVGVAATGAALVLGHSPEPGSVAVHIGLLVLAGGIGQTLLAVAAWPLRRHRPERLALAGLYRELAHIARRPPGTSVGPPAGDTLTAVRLTLYGLGHDHGPSVEAYRVLLDEAERIRREVVVLDGMAERLGIGSNRSAAEAIGAVLACSGSVLAEIADALSEARAIEPTALERDRARIRASLAVIEDVEVPGNELTRRAAAARIRALAGQLRAAVATSQTGASEGGQAEPSTYGVRRLRAPLTILRANLTPDSAVLRHALRLAVLVAGSDLVVRLSGADRGYWIPLTIMVVLRPDFATTFQRSSMRVAGTIVGLLLATALVHWIPGGQWYQIVLIGLFLFGMRFAGPGNLALGAAALAALVVILLTLDGIPAHTTLVLRAEDTLIGGGLALLAMLASPFWERSLVADRLGELLAAYRNYAAAVMDASAGSGRLQQARMRSRLARTNARASVDRARAEPVAGRGQVELGETVLVHTHRFIHAMLAIDAVRNTIHRAGPTPYSSAFQELMSQVAAVLSGCEQAVRAGRPPRTLPALRPTQEALIAMLRTLPVDPENGGASATAATIADATDRIANSLDTLVDELRRQLRVGIV